MGNYNCYEQNENEKIQIKSYEPKDFINIDNNEFFISDSIEQVSLDYSQTNKGNITISSFNQINNTINTFQSKIKISKSFEQNNNNKNEQNNLIRQNSVKIIKDNSFPNNDDNKLINKSTFIKGKNDLILTKDLNKSEPNNRTQIVKIININNYFPQTKSINIQNIKAPQKNKYKNNFKSNLNEEELANKMAKKIQLKYHSIKNKLNYKKNILPKLKKESDIYIQHLLEIMSQSNPLLYIENQNKLKKYSLTNYQKFYPKDDPFFIYNYGKVFNNQIRIKKISQDDFSIYQGEMNMDNQRHGFGKLFTKNNILIGTWRKNEFTGWCREIDNNGNYLEGKYIDGYANGKGILGDLEGNQYIGDFIDSIRCGKGVLITDKFHYQGDFMNNMMHGYGNINFLVDGNEYEGQFKNNLIEGWGVFYWKNGDRYEGQMKNGKMHGKGKLYYNNGDILEGVFENGNKK